MRKAIEVQGKPFSSCPPVQLLAYRTAIKVNYHVNSQEIWRKTLPWNKASGKKFFSIMDFSLLQRQFDTS